MQAWQTTCTPAVAGSRGNIPTGDKVKFSTHKTSGDSHLMVVHSSDKWQQQRKAWLLQGGWESITIGVDYQNQIHKSPNSISIVTDVFLCQCEFTKVGTRKNCYLPLSTGHCRQFSHISTAVSKDSGVFLPFTLSSSSLETVQEETFVSFYLIKFLAGFCTKD